LVDKKLPLQVYKQLLYKKIKKQKNFFKIEIAASEKNTGIAEQLNKFIKFYLKIDLIERIALFLLVEELLGI
jgi:hypothetical protein